MQLRKDGGTPIAEKPGHARACHGPDLPVDVDAANSLVQSVGDVEVALVVKGEAAWGMKNSRKSRPGIAAVTRFAGAGHCLDHAVAFEPADHIIPGVGDEQRVAETDREA